jgi:hypothetical protein
MCAHQSGLEGISAAAIPPEQEAVGKRDSSIAELLLDLAKDPVLDARLRSLLALIESNPSTPSATTLSRSISATPA